MNPTPLDIIIPAGSVPSTGTDCVDVTAVEDDLVEGDHEFDIIIISASNDELTAVSSGSPDINTVTITDDDGIFVSVTHSPMYGLA